MAIELKAIKQVSDDRLLVSQISGYPASSKLDDVIDLDLGKTNESFASSNPHLHISSEYTTLNISDSISNRENAKTQSLDNFHPPEYTSQNDVMGEDENSLNRKGCSGAVGKVQRRTRGFLSRNTRTIKWGIDVVLIAGYLAFLIYAMIYEFGSESSVRLLWMTLFAVFIAVVTVVKARYGDKIYSTVIAPPTALVKQYFKYIKSIFILLVIAGLIAFLVVEVALKRPANLISLSGIVIYVILLFIFSANPAMVRWRTVLWGLGLQFVFALLVLRTSFGFEVFRWLGDRIEEFMEYADEGAEFVFGENFEDHFFAFKAMPVVVFFGSVISILEYLGVMQIIILKIAWVMQRVMATTGAESVNAAGNIFIGQTVAVLLVRPYINNMTRSELHAVMVGGFATIAGSLLATYVTFGVPANHLISASIMAAPCALAMSKLFYPEDEISETTGDDMGQMANRKQRNIIEAASKGASDSIVLIANIVVNLIAFMSLLAFVNTTLTWLGHRAGLWAPEYPELTFQLICSYILWPFAFTMGVASSDCRKVAQLIGVKTFINEFVAYTELSTIIENSDIWRNYTGEYDRINDDIFLHDYNMTLVGGVLESRSIVISTYALCGFANFGSIGTVIGALSAMAPEKSSIIASLALRAMIAGNVVSFMTASTAGLLYQGE